MWRSASGSESEHLLLPDSGLSTCDFDKRPDNSHSSTPNPGAYRLPYQRNDNWKLYRHGSIHIWMYYNYTAEWGRSTWRVDNWAQKNGNVCTDPPYAPLIWGKKHLAAVEQGCKCQVHIIAWNTHPLERNAHSVRFLCIFLSRAIIVSKRCALNGAIILITQTIKEEYKTRLYMPKCCGKF